MENELILQTGLFLAVDVLSILSAALIFAFVLTFVLAIYGQRGKVEITPEREIALAAGAADRRTVFEMPLLQPIMWLLLQVVKQLPIRKSKEKIYRMLVAAGSPNFYTPEEYLAVALLWGCAIAIILEILNLMFSLGIIFPIFGFLAGFAGAIYRLHDQAAKRIRMINRRLPYTLDLIALAMGAGATFSEAVKTLIIEDPDHPVNVEFATVLADVELGTTREQALKNLAERIPLESLRSIVAAIIQAENLGTPLSDVLKQQADLMRLQRSVRAEKLAAAASVRILVPSLLIMISVVLTVFAPLIIRGLRGKIF